MCSPAAPALAYSSTVRHHLALAETGVGVGDERQAAGVGDLLDEPREVLEREQADVGNARADTRRRAETYVASKPASQRRAAHRTLNEPGIMSAVPAARWRSRRSPQPSPGCRL